MLTAQSQHCLKDITHENAPKTVEKLKPLYLLRERFCTTLPCFENFRVLERKEKP